MAKTSLVKLDVDTSITSKKYWEELEEVFTLFGKKRKEFKEKETPVQHRDIRPDGYEYVDGNYMIDQLWEYCKNALGIDIIEMKDVYIPNVDPRYAHHIRASVKVTDRSTGNWVVGADSAMVMYTQLKRNGSPVVQDGREIWIPAGYGNAVKSSLTKAIKKAEAYFQICADVYNLDIPDYSKLVQVEVQEMARFIENNMSQDDFKRFKIRINECYNDDEALEYLDKLREKFKEREKPKEEKKQEKVEKVKEEVKEEIQEVKFKSKSSIFK